jgi:DNA-binding FadR family transcriptional regulator
MSAGETLSPRTSRAEALSRRLEAEISTQAIAPGQRLGTKEELRRRFRVAIGTLNEAVRLMESRGLVAARPGPGGGVFVADVPAYVRLSTMLLGLDWSSATLRDCSDLRATLEPAICRRAARAAGSRDAGDLRRLVDEMQATLPDAHAYLVANWRFHRRVAELCDNVPMRGVYLTALDFLERGLDDFDFTGHDQRAVAIHRELAEAIAEGEGPRLERAVRAHMRRSPLHPR